MTKKARNRIIGILCIIIGIGIGYFSENSIVHILAGALVGFGTMTLITGKIAILHRL